MENEHTIGVIGVRCYDRFAFWAWVFACANLSFCASAITRLWLKYSIYTAFSFSTDTQREMTHPAFSTVLLICFVLWCTCTDLVAGLHDPNIIQASKILVSRFPAHLAVFSSRYSSIFCWRKWPPHWRRRLNESSKKCEGLESTTEWEVRIRSKSTVEVTSHKRLSHKRPFSMANGKWRTLWALIHLLLVLAPDLWYSNAKKSRPLPAAGWVSYLARWCSRLGKSHSQYQ